MPICRKCTSSEPQPPPNAKVIKRYVSRSERYEPVTYTEEHGPDPQE